MRLIFVLFDTLNRLAFGPHGGTIGTPKFDRFAERAVTFDRHYVGSLPIPARRDIQTGRANFFPRSWGPMEPYDGSFCEVRAARLEIMEMVCHQMGVNTFLPQDEACSVDPTTRA